MKLKMAKNSLFAVLLRSPWWLSLAIGLGIGGAGASFAPEAYKVVGALSGFPFLVIAAMAAWRQRGQPSQAQIDHTLQALQAMNWAQFAPVLEAAFKRDGFAVQRTEGGACDFELQLGGKRMLVAARRWKAANTGTEPLRALQAARLKADVADALFITLGELGAPAAKLAASERIAVWQAPELAQKLRGLLPPKYAS